MFTPSRCLHCNLVRYFSSGETDFMRCTRCGLVLRQPMPTFEELDDIYARLYRDRQIVNGQTNQESGAHALRQYASFLASSVLTPQGRVLDYGCGSGALVEQLRARGMAADGVERSNGAREFCAHKRGITLWTDLSSVPARSLDAVTMIEVIEHLPDPLATVVEIQQRLKPGGLIFVTTPNRRSLRARLEGGHWREATKKFHVVLFDAASLSRLLSEAGCADVRRLRYSPVQRPGAGRWLATRAQQMLGLAGTLCFVARKAP